MNQLEQLPVLTTAEGSVTYAMTTSPVISHCYWSMAVAPAPAVAVTTAIEGAGSQQRRSATVAVGDGDGEAQPVAA